jgi:hypothetical protein
LNSIVIKSFYCFKVSILYETLFRVMFLRKNISMSWRNQAFCLLMSKHAISHYTIWFNRDWVDTRWQQYVTQLHTNNTCTHNTEKGKFGKCGPCPVFASYTLEFVLQLRKKHGKTSVRVAKYKNNKQYNTQKKNSNTE